VPDQEIEQITHLNALRFFHSDALAKAGGRANATVGALRAQARDVDLTPLRTGGGKPPAEHLRPVTAGDVLKQLVTALDGNARQAS
jgi:hypothetical protein